MSEACMGFCIYVDKTDEGSIPTERSTDGNPIVFPTRHAAERRIAEDTMERIQQFLKGERQFEDAMIMEKYVVEVDVSSDGSICDESGTYFEKSQLVDV